MSWLGESNSIYYSIEATTETIVAVVAMTMSADDQDSHFNGCDWDKDHSSIPTARMSWIVKGKRLCHFHLYRDIRG